MNFQQEFSGYADSFNDEKFSATVKTLISQPWSEWFKTLLVRLCQAFFPTINARNSVDNLEKLFHGNLDFLTGEMSPDFVRFLGHLQAILDYSKEKVSPENRAKYARWESEHPNLKTSAVVEKITRDLNFQEKADFLKNFTLAYNSTFTPLGELCGTTEATPFYLRLLVWSLLISATRPPESVAELHRWMISLEVRPKLSHFDELCRQDSDAVELERMQQIYARLGLKFGKNKKSDETSINKGGKIHPSLPPNA